MIVAALYHRRPSLMAQPEWSAALSYTPDSDHRSPSISVLPYLLDTLAQIPALYSERDTIVSHLHTEVAREPASRVGKFCSSALARSLIERSLGLLAGISCRRWQWKASHPGSEFPSLPQTQIPSTQPCPCKVFTHFSSLQVANAFTLYNTLVILINRFIISMFQLLSIDDLDVDAESLASEQVLAGAKEILQSIDYHLPHTQPTGTVTLDGSGPRNFYIIFPLRVAYQALSQSETQQALNQRLWLKDVFSIIKARAGPWATNQKIFTVD
jgi:hypothetical protein